MTLVAPFALVGLLALPVIWWLHRRASRPQLVEVPSLLFLREEAAADVTPRRRFDAELLLALAAATLLAFAAAGPVLRAGEPGRTVRVVVLGGAPAQARGFALRAHDVLDVIRERLRPSDRLDEVREPPVWSAPRPTEDTLFSAARAAEASLRVVVSDRAPTGETGDVRWVALGSPDVVSAGIAAASVEPKGEGVTIFVNLFNASTKAVTTAVSVRADAFEATRSVALVSDAFASETFELRPAPAWIQVVASTEDDQQSFDNDVLFVREQPLAIAVGDDLPVSLRKALLQAVELATGRRPVEEDELADLFVVSGKGRGPFLRRGLVLGVAGADARRAGDGPDAATSDPLVRDLTTAGVDIVYAPEALALEDGESVLLARSSDRTWPVVTRRGMTIRFVPDPTKGNPAPVDTPLWPLFVENLVREVAGAPTPGGYRVKGLFDVESTRLGRDVKPFDPAWLDAAVPDRPAPERPLRPWLVGGALLCLALLWLAPRRARSLAPA